VKNDDSQLSIKTKSIDYLPRTVKLSLPNENKPGSKTTDPILFHLYTELVNSVDEKEKKMKGNKVPFKYSNFDRLFVLNILESTDETSTTCDESTPEKKKKKEKLKMMFIVIKYTHHLQHCQIFSK
jgi:hypothetical protein